MAENENNRSLQQIGGDNKVFPRVDLSAGTQMAQSAPLRKTPTAAKELQRADPNLSTRLHMPRTKGGR